MSRVDLTELRRLWEAAAKTLRHEVPESEVLTLAAQALEAWAWVAEKQAKVMPWGLVWRCSDDEEIRVYSDTPLGAVLAAMEGEKDGEA